MNNNSAAILIGDQDGLPRQLWAGFVESGLVDYIVTFHDAMDLAEAATAPRPPTVDLNVRLIFFVAQGPEALTVPMDLKVHRRLSRVPLIGFYTPGAGLMRSDIQTLYKRRVTSIIPLPLRFNDLGQLVLKLDRYWSVGQFPDSRLDLPKARLFEPSDDDAASV